MVRTIKFAPDLCHAPPVTSNTTADKHESALANRPTTADKSNFAPAIPGITADECKAATDSHAIAPKQPTHSLSLPLRTLTQVQLTATPAAFAPSESRQQPTPA